MTNGMYLLTELDENGNETGCIALSPNSILSVVQGPFKDSARIRFGIEDSECVLVWGSAEAVMYDIARINEIIKENNE